MHEYVQVAIGIISSLNWFDRHIPLPDMEVDSLGRIQPPNFLSCLISSDHIETQEYVLHQAEWNLKDYYV